MGNEASNPTTEPVVTVSRRKRTNTTAITATYTNHSRTSRPQGTVRDASHAMTTSFHASTTSGTTVIVGWSPGVATSPPLRLGTCESVC